MTLLVKTTLVLQYYMVCKILVKILAILDAKLLFDRHLCTSISMFCKNAKIRISCRDEIHLKENKHAQI